MMNVVNKCDDLQLGHRYLFGDKLGENYNGILIYIDYVSGAGTMLEFAVEATNIVIKCINTAELGILKLLEDK